MYWMNLFPLQLNSFFVRLVRSLSSLSWVNVAVNSVACLKSLCLRSWGGSDGWEKAAWSHSRLILALVKGLPWQRGELRATTSTRHQWIWLLNNGNDQIAGRNIEQLMSWTLLPFSFSCGFCSLTLWTWVLSAISQDAMVVILKSLVPGCLFNIIGFGSTFKALFTTSQNYEEVKQFNQPTDRSINQLKISTQVNLTICSSTLL